MTNLQEHEKTFPRRAIFKEAATLFLGAVITVVPFFAGLLVLLDPLKRKSAAGIKVRVASLNGLPNDMIPRKFPVVGSRTDAWNQYAETPLGAVYLRRTGEKTVQAFNGVCPHAGCFVDFRLASKDYLCPCHNSAFGLDGRVSDPRSPSPRSLDELQVEILNDSEIWVYFQNFRSGTSAKIPTA